MSAPFMIRLAKVLLVASMGFFALLAGWGNVVDPASNFAFVQHVLRMDTIFPDSPMTGRAIDSGTLHWTAFWAIVATEFLVAALCLIGALILAFRLGATAAIFNDAKGPAVAGLALGVLLWFTGFMVVGGEWFLMWQSGTWNGISSAFRFAAMMLLTLIFLTAEDRA